MTAAELSNDSFLLSNNRLQAVKLQVYNCQMTGRCLSDVRLPDCQTVRLSDIRLSDVRLLGLLFLGLFWLHLLDAYLVQEKSTFEADDSRNVTRAECLSSLPFCIFLASFPRFPIVFP